MALHLAQIELLVLFMLMLCLALLETPIPRAWALAAAALVAVQTAALHAMQARPTSFADDPAPHAFSGLDDVIAVVVVPALTVGLFVVVCWYLARANARVRHAALRHRQRHADGLGRSGLSGRLHDGQLDRR
jgi:hypothetical protein